MSLFPRRERDFFGHIHGWPERPAVPLLEAESLSETQRKYDEWKAKMAEERELSEVSRAVVGVRERRERCQR